MLNEKQLIQNILKKPKAYTQKEELRKFMDQSLPLNFPSLMLHAITHGQTWRITKLKFYKVHETH